MHWQLKQMNCLFAGQFIHSPEMVANELLAQVLLQSDEMQSSKTPEAPAPKLPLPEPTDSIEEGEVTLTGDWADDKL